MQVVAESCLEIDDALTAAIESSVPYDVADKKNFEDPCNGCPLSRRGVTRGSLTSRRDENTTGTEKVRRYGWMSRVLIRHKWAMGQVSAQQQSQL